MLVVAHLVLLSLFMGFHFPKSRDYHRNTAEAAQIRIGPNILVSRDGWYPHVETAIASNPHRPGHLIGGSICMNRIDIGAACKTYASFDGGFTWIDTVIPEQIEGGGVDPQVVFSQAGTPLFVGLTNKRDSQGHETTHLYCHRSKTAGKNWLTPVDLGTGFDHPQMVVDRSGGKYSGRIYIGALHSRSIGVFYSDDDGRTFTGPIEAIEFPKGKGLQVTSLLVLSDSTLILCYNEFPSWPSETEYTIHRRVVLSKDGGTSFSKPRLVNSDNSPSYTNRELMQFQGFPCFAADSNSMSFLDRVYVAWIKFNDEKARLYFSYSNDGCESWAEQCIVDASIPKSAQQFQPAIAVNRKGDVGVIWMDTRGLQEGEYNVYFTCSLDGGMSFLPPVCLSTSLSYRWSKDNLTFFPSAVRAAQDIMISTYSVAMRWGSGGDYIGMTGDSEGVFHPFWPDSRLGSFQVYTCRVEILSKSPSLRASNVRNKGGRCKNERICINEKIELIFDPTFYHEKSRKLLLPIRMKNISDTAIYGPISIEIVSCCPSWGKLFKDKAPVFLNSVNAKTQNGAVIDYSGALRHLNALEPGAVSDAVTWILEVKDPLLLPPITVSIYGNIKINHR